MASPKRRAGAVFRVGNTSHVYQPYTNVVALVKGYNSALYCAQTPMASKCSIRSPCRFGQFHFTPNGAHARHESSCAKKHLKNCTIFPENMLCYEQVLTQKNGAHRSHSAMVSHSKSGARRVKISWRGVLELSQELKV